METPAQTTCPVCHAAALTSAYFCPNCGKALKPKPPATTWQRQTVVYFISIFLPPFGLWYAWQYLKQSDDLSKKIGWVALILTVISLAFSVWLTLGLIDSVNKSLDSLNNLNF